MKGFRRLIVIICILLIGMFVAINLVLIHMNRQSDDREYMVEINRLANDMRDGKKADISDCKYIKRIVKCEDTEAIVAKTKYDYVIEDIEGSLYRIEYKVHEGAVASSIIMVDIAYIFMSIVVVMVLIYIRKKIILPFNKMEEIPYELSKGNLALELPEEKTKYFGKFIWGTNMLKDNLEKRRQNELNMHRDKKLLLLSLTHDIKTPLSVIKLNAQALSKGLYKDEDKKKASAEAISGKVDEIEKYVTDIIAASKDEFLDLSVKEEEFYLSQLINKLADYYRAKMELNKTRFDIDKYEECLLCADENRLGEVLQNIIENAIKYGDGQRISITFDREDGCQLITVTNSGSGIKHEEMIHIFDSFYRGSNASDRQGSGLGLYICRQLMNNMNGDIFASQEDDVFSITVVVRLC